jgi:hypothetical protein
MKSSSLVFQLILAKQVEVEHCEAICRDGNELIIISEKGKLYKLEENDLIVLRE